MGSSKCVSELDDPPLPLASECASAAPEGERRSGHALWYARRRALARGRAHQSNT